MFQLYNIIIQHLCAVHTPMFMEALFTITKNWKQPKCSLMIGWINKV